MHEEKELKTLPQILFKNTIQNCRSDALFFLPQNEGCFIKPVWYIDRWRGVPSVTLHVYSCWSDIP